MKWKHVLAAGVLGTLLGCGPMVMATEVPTTLAYAEMYHQGDLIGKTLFPQLAENYNRYHHELYNDNQLKAYHYGIEHGVLAIVSPDADSGYKGQCGLIGKDGNFIIPLEKYTYMMANGTGDKISAEKDGETLTYDLQGNIIERVSKEETEARQKAFMEEYKKAGKLQLPDMSQMDPYRMDSFDNEGKVYVNGEYVDSWYAFGRVVKQKGMLAFVNNNGNVLIGPGPFEVAAEKRIDNDTGLIAFMDKTTGKVGVFSMYDGTPVVPMQYDNVTFCGGGRLLLERQDVAVLVDQSTGNVVAELPRGNIPSLPQFGQFSSFAISPFGLEDVTWMSTFYDYDKGELGKIRKLQIIDRNGTVKATIERMDAERIAETMMLSRFKNGYATIKMKGKWGIVDSNGNWIVQPIYKWIELV